MPDNGIALERREAPGPSQGPARPGTPTTLKALGPGILARRSADRKAGLTEPRTLRRRLPALHLLLPEGRKKGTTGRPGRPNSKSRDCGALAERIEK